MLRFSSVLAAVVAVVAVIAGPACTLFDSPCPGVDVSVTLNGRDRVPLEDATVTASTEGVDSDCPHVGAGSYDCGQFADAQIVDLRIEGPGYRRDIPGEPFSEPGTCSLSYDTLVEIPEAGGPACCCASIVEGDIIEEAPADSTAACIAREQGRCVDQATIDQRLTPHACCPDATGERCGD